MGPQPELGAGGSVRDGAQKRGNRVGAAPFEVLDRVVQTMHCSGPLGRIVPEPRFGLRVCTVHDIPRDQRWAATSLTVQTMSHTIHRLSPGTMFIPLRGAGSEKAGEPESALREIRNGTRAGHCRCRTRTPADGVVGQ